MGEINRLQLEIPFWFSCPKFTVLVIINHNGFITGAAPIIKRFVGQPFCQLQWWVEKKGWVPWTFEDLRDGRH